nr:hypothetical protein [Paenibacillus silvisoli]
MTVMLGMGDGSPLRLSLDRGDLWDTRLVPEVLDKGFTYRNLIELVREGDQEQISRRYSDFFSEYPNPTKLPAGRIEMQGPAAESMTCRLHLREARAEVKWQAGESSYRLETFLHAENGLGYIRLERGEEQELRPTEWVYLVAANHDGEDWLERAKAKVMSAVQEGYDSAFPGHSAWWERYWQRSELTLSEFEMEKQWYLTNYLFGSCSRKGAPPLPLQGVWTADEGKLPPWKGDYHHDLNTELSCWHYLKANHLEEGEAYLDFLWNLRPAARDFAQSYYESAGINLPSVMTMDGKPLGGWPMYSLSPTNQIWLCQAFDHYWLYIGDREFLADKAYVYFTETANCLLDLLRQGEDGKLRLPISSSPEVHDDSLHTPNRLCLMTVIPSFWSSVSAQGICC